MEIVIPAVALVAILFLVGRRVPMNGWLFAVLTAAILIVGVVTIERLGFWPETWRR